MADNSTRMPPAPAGRDGDDRSRPGPDERAPPALRVGGLLIAILIVVIVFTLLSKPNTFLTITNALGIMRSMSTIAIVALGLPLVIVVGEIDLSFGFMYGLASILIGVAWIVWGWPIWAAIILAFGGGRRRRLRQRLPGDGGQDPVVHRHPRHRASSSSGTTLLVSNTATLNPATRRRARSCRRARSTASSACPTRTCHSAVPDAGAVDDRRRARHRVPAQPLAVRLPAQGDRRQPGWRPSSPACRSASTSSPRSSSARAWPRSRRCSTSRSSARSSRTPASGCCSRSSRP